MNDEDIFLKVEGFTLLEHNAETGITTYFRTNEDGSTTIYSRQDIAPILENNVALFNESQGLKNSDWQLIARPGDLLMDQLGLSKAIEQKDRKFLGKILNSSDYRKLRTFDSQV